MERQGTWTIKTIQQMKYKAEENILQFQNL